MTGRPLTALRKKKQSELSELLIRQLQARPWLLILDGLERVLVGYHRYDAAQLADEQAGLSDEISRRDPCSAIRPFDDDLLRQLAADGPSKVLITSRLVPRVLVNAAGQPIPGVLHERLPGLRPADAEALLRTCGVRGDSQRIQDYLQRHCDCHPLVTGIVAGLINDYLPDRGNFDAWAAEPGHGGQLDLAHLDLTQKRNHILAAAIAALPNPSRQLLSTLSLLPESFDYAILAAFNPHLPPRPQEVAKPEQPRITGRIWKHLSKEDRARRRLEYAGQLDRWREYKRAGAAWRSATQSSKAAAALTVTVHDLEQRGLLQYDRLAGHWDLHPVVRAVAFGGLRDRDRDFLGQKIIDHFAQRPHHPFEEAVTLDDLRDGITVVRTLFQMGRQEEAWEALDDDLVDALNFNLEAYPESLSLLRPFFPNGWSELPEDINGFDLDSIMNDAIVALSGLGEHAESVNLGLMAVRIDAEGNDWSRVGIDLANLCENFYELNRLAVSARCSMLALSLAEARDEPMDLFRSRLVRFKARAVAGHHDKADEMWSLLDPMGRGWPRGLYLPGTAEIWRLEYLLFPQGRLTEEDLATTERIARTGYHREGTRNLHRLRGEWRLARDEFALAAESLQEAIRMAHEAGFPDAQSETRLALARFRLQQLPAGREEASRLSAARSPAHFPLAELWLALGDTDQAIKHAKAAFRHAWADGEPYVRRHDLDRSRALLQQLGENIPELPVYDPVENPKETWEDEIDAAIVEFRKQG